MKIIANMFAGFIVAVLIILVSPARSHAEVTTKKYAHTGSHFAMPVEDIETVKNFYASVFEVPVHEGKTPDGRPIYAVEIGALMIAFHQVPRVERDGVNCVPENWSEIDKIRRTYFIPSQHFGLFHLTPEEFEGIVARLRQNDARFVLEPTVVNCGSNHEQLLTFAMDPQGYVIEIRASRAERGFNAKEFEQQASENTKAEL